MATVLDRAWYDTLVQDDGSGTLGSVWDKADVDSMMDAIDAVFANDLALGADLAIAGTLEVVGDAGGVAAFAGDRYSHVFVAAGLNANPLTHQHQVGFYAAHQANSNTGVSDGFVAGFESAIGLAAGTYAQAVPKMAAFAVGGFSGGAGSSLLRSWNVSAVDQTFGTNNAVLAMWDSVFSGNHFIYYEGARPSRLSGGDLIGPSEIYRSIDTSFLRIAGGNAGGGGAHILMFGASHASAANKGQLNASAGWTVFGDFLFTDATYDIGKAGATRPRDGFFSRNVVVGGTFNPVGAVTLSNHVAGTPTFAAGDKYLVVNASGQIHVSALGPAS